MYLIYIGFTLCVSLAKSEFWKITLKKTLAEAGRVLQERHQARKAEKGQEISS